MLSDKIVTHKAIVKNLDGRGITKYNLTKNMYSTYKIAKMDRKLGDFIWITDIDGNKLREIDPIEFKEFEEIQKDNSMYGAIYICNYGTRHPISELGVCSCYKIYGVFGFTFQDKLKSLGYKFNYPKEITREMKDAFLSS